MGKGPPIKNTSGEGFAVEDAVVALLACHLLTGVSWPGAGEGTLKSIQCQMRQDGWGFDDAILNFERDELKWRCACSIKSFAVFGPEGAPLDFSNGLWDQWLDREGSGFTQGTDSLALIAAQHEPDIREAWFGVCDSARQIAPDVFARRFTAKMEPSALRRAAFESLMRPETKDGPEHDPVETCRLLASFRLFEHDFQHAEPSSIVQATLLCQQALVDAERGRARELWGALILYCGGIRRKGGQITLVDLLDALAHRFRLKQYPRFSADWEKVLSFSRDRMSAMSTKIGGKTIVPRVELLNELNNRAEAQGVVVILGESGNGKSTIASRWASQQEAVWLDATELSCPGGFQSHFGLNHRFSDLFTSASNPTRLVLDRLDRCFNEAALGAVAQVLRVALSDECRVRWQVALTCRPEDWERVRGNLARRGIRLPSNPIRVDRFSENEAEAICRETPELFRLWQRLHLRSVLKWPKALDLVAAYSQPGVTEPNWTSESDFSRWFWEQAILDGKCASIRGRAVRKLAVCLADRTTNSAPLDEFLNEETHVLEEMQREGYLEIDGRRQTVRFSHDLIADWVRQHELVVQGASASRFLREMGSGTGPRLQSPLWHQAVRSYGLALLEHSEKASEWQAFFDAFDESSDTDIMARNLLLQAPVFSTNQRNILERLRPVLEANNGALLQRFLREFLRAATIPDEDLVNQFCVKYPDWRIRAAALFRQPWFPYWPDVIEFLAVTPERVVALALEEVVDVCQFWFRYRGITTVGMQNAAKLSIAAATWVYRDEYQWNEMGLETSAAEKACQALFAAAPDFPTEVANLALKLSGRRPPDPEDIPANLRSAIPAGSPLISSVGVPVHSFWGDTGRPLPWPEGPQCEGAHVFTRAFLSFNHNIPFIRALPEVAAEVMFGVLLDLPHENSGRDRWGHDLDEHGFNNSHDLFRNPLWTSGPFFMFLQINPIVGLPAIIRLVNFATDRALELPRREQIRIPLKVDGQTQVWRGHQYSYQWYQGHLHGPSAVGCALVSLEKWLYILMDNGEPIGDFLATIMRESRSIAFAGLLICVGKRNPELFLGSLRPLLEVIEFHWMDELTTRSQEANSFNCGFYDTTPHLVKMWQDWMAMPHRKESIDRVVVKHMLTAPNWSRLMEECRPRWLARINAATPENPAPYWFLKTVAQLNPTNWRKEKNEKGTIYYCDLSAELPPPPADITERLEHNELLSLIPFQCRQILRGEEKCSEEQIANWWARLDVIRELPVQEENRGIIDPENAICGIIAVAVVKHREWLVQDPAREQQALETLDRIGKNPPSRFGWGDESELDFKWDVFAAWALTTLWCEKQEAPFLLQAVGALVLCHRHLVAARVMMIAAQHRAQLHGAFDRLLAHAVRYAPILHRLRTQSFFPNEPAPPDQWTAEHIDKFIAGQTEPLPNTWQTLTEPQKQQEGKARETGGIDIGYLAAVTGWAKDPSQSSSEAERQQWLNIHRQVLLCALARAEQEIEATADSASSSRSEHVQPYKDDEGVLERIACIVANLPLGADHVSFWEPIFALGCRGDRWVKSFVGWWFVRAACGDAPAPGFIEQWLAMLDHAEKSPAWCGERHLKTACSEMWKHLLGLAPFTWDFWSESLADAVNTVWPFYDRWAREHAHDNHAITSFICFLQTPAAVSRRVDGLRLLYETVPRESVYFWDRGWLQDSILNFLQILFHEHWEDIIGNTAAREAFMVFASKLRSLQHPAGSELHAVAGERLRKAE